MICSVIHHIVNARHFCKVARSTIRLIGNKTLFCLVETFCFLFRDAQKYLLIDFAQTSILLLTLLTLGSYIVMDFLRLFQPVRENR